MQKLDLLNDHNLVFIDIEATDKKGQRKIVQFSGIRVNLDGSTQEINLVINPQQPLSNHIVNLLKIDDEYLKNKPLFCDVENQIIDFINDCYIISFGSFDADIIRETILDKSLKLNFFDFQHYLKQYSKNNVALLEIHQLVCDCTSNKLQHDALYDAIMLKDLFYALKDLDYDNLKMICEASHIMPRSTSPKHKIFSKLDFANNNWTNTPHNGQVLFVNELCAKQFTKNKKQQSISYLVDLECQYFSGHKLKTISWHNNIRVGEYVYDVYLDDVENVLNLFLMIAKDKAIFFNRCSKEKINHFTETIYDATKKLVTLNYVNLNYINKKYRLDNGFNKFNEMVGNLPMELQNKFGPFYKKQN